MDETEETLGRVRRISLALAPFLGRVRDVETGLGGVNVTIPLERESPHGLRIEEIYKHRQLEFGNTRAWEISYDQALELALTSLIYHFAHGSWFQNGSKPSGQHVVPKTYLKSFFQKTNNGKRIGQLNPLTGQTYFQSKDAPFEEMDFYEHDSLPPYLVENFLSRLERISSDIIEKYQLNRASAEMPDMLVLERVNFALFVALLFLRSPLRTLENIQLSELHGSSYRPTVPEALIESMVWKFQLVYERRWMFVSVDEINHNGFLFGLDPLNGIGSGYLETIWTLPISPDTVLLLLPPESEFAKLKFSWFTNLEPKLEPAFEILYQLFYQKAPGAPDPLGDGRLLLPTSIRHRGSYIGSFLTDASNISMVTRTLSSVEKMYWELWSDDLPSYKAREKVRKWGAMYFQSNTTLFKNIRPTEKMWLRDRLPLF